MDAFDEDEIARAIAASLEDVTGPSTTTETLVISDDDEEPQTAPPPPQLATTAGTNSFMSERAQLEKERRERARKYREAAGLKDDDSMQGQSSPVASSSRPAQAKIRPTPAVKVPDEDQLFFDGELRPIAVKGGEPRRDRKSTFKLTQVLGKKSDVAFAILSTYASDIPWIHEFFEPSVPVIFLTTPEKLNGELAMHYVLPNWIRVAAKINGYGCQHMKFMLIFYKTGRLRVVVSTANLVAHDWRDLENLAWLQDIPPRATAIPHDPKQKEDFPSVMHRVLHGLGAKEALALMKKEHSLPLSTIEDLRARWDWSKVRVHLVPSIAGKHEGWPDVIVLGHVRLMKAILNLGLAKRPGELTIEYQGSSLGNYSSSWLNEFYSSASGISPQDYLDKPKSMLTKRPLLGQIDIIFPTKATVQASLLGEPGGGTIFCRRAQFETIKKHGRKLRMHDSKSTAGNVLMHSKMLLGMFPERDEDFDSSDSEVEVVDADGKPQPKAIGWAYVGSHNFTPSAWGNVSGSAFNPVINIKNYELGIVFPIHSKAELEKVTFWERPAMVYGPGDEPWVQDESDMMRG